MSMASSEGVHAPFGGTGTNESVKFIDKQNDFTLIRSDILDNSLHTIFELSSELGTSNQGSEIEGENPLVLDGVRNISVDDTDSKTLNDSSLTNTYTYKVRL
jgi:hypothetical protein